MDEMLRIIEYSHKQKELEYWKDFIAFMKSLELEHDKEKNA